MKKIVLAMTMVVMCALLGILGSGSPAQALAPASPAAAAPADETECDAAAVSEDAASCSAGGWSALGTCCFASGRAFERYQNISTGRTKCCGACFQ